MDFPKNLLGISHRTHVSKNWVFLVNKWKGIGKLWKVRSFTIGKVKYCEPVQPQTFMECIKVSLVNNTKPFFLRFIQFNSALSKAKYKWPEALCPGIFSPEMWNLPHQLYVFRSLKVWHLLICFRTFSSKWITFVAF